MHADCNVIYNVVPQECNCAQQPAIVDTDLVVACCTLHKMHSRNSILMLTMKFNSQSMRILDASGSVVMKLAQHVSLLS